MFNEIMKFNIRTLKYGETSKRNQLEIKRLFELFCCVSGTATNSILVVFLAGLCCLILILIIVCPILFIRRRSKKRLFIVAETKL